MRVLIRIINHGLIQIIMLKLSRTHSESSRIILLWKCVTILLLRMNEQKSFSASISSNQNAVADTSLTRQLSLISRLIQCNKPTSFLHGVFISGKTRVNGLIRKAIWQQFAWILNCWKHSRRNSLEVEKLLFSWSVR